MGHWVKAMPPAEDCETFRLTGVANVRPSQTALG